MRTTMCFSGLLGVGVVPMDGPDGGDRRHDAPGHAEAFGDLPPMIDPTWLEQQVRAVALTGRGGAHFPVAAKWEASRKAAVAGWTVVANGAEGEPASGKDAALLQFRPHLVLDGAEIAAGMVDAERIVISIAEQAEASLRSVRLALEERTGRPGPRPQIVTTAERYLSGESSAVIQAAQGGPGLPRTTFDPARPWSGGRPVLVHNVESLARLGLLARTGADTYTAGSLVTLTDGDRRLVIEVPDDETFAELLARAEVPAPQAVLLGGYGGEWVRWSELEGLTVDPHELRAAKRSLGAGVLIALRHGQCGLQATAPIARWLAGQSSGQCGPCRFGLPTVADLVERLARTPGRKDLQRLDAQLALVDGRGACRLPDGAARMVRSALQTFAEEVLAHGRGQCISVGGPQ